MKTNGAGRREHQEEIRGARASGWTEAHPYGRGLLLPLMLEGRVGNCRPDCVSLPRVITYGVNPAHFNRKDRQFLPKSMRVANVNNVAGRGESSIPTQNIARSQRR
jgi:hypothetical protein